ncbi:MAG TPA: adenylate/guanylate cyclase domain-containing protein [Bacteroidales bacterium]|jgi:PAS domain S-box-containing protein|nr:adenylate/guanylate cyclase domain-containing protein [Bacteroidales bacterium]
MGFKVVIVDDKKAGKELLNTIESMNEVGGVFDGISKTLPVSEISKRLKKAYDFIAADEDLEQKIKKIKEEREIIIKYLSTSIHAPFSFMLLKPSGQIEWVNDGFEKIHGHKLSEYLESHGNTIFSLDPSSEIGNLFNKCLKERKSVDSIVKLKSRKGGAHWIQVYITPQLNLEGKIEELIAVEIDITVFKNKEDELHAQNVKIKEIARELEKTNVLLEEQKQEIHVQKQTIELEQEKSEKLLLNILPFEVARQLKTKGRAGTRSYKLVSVLFADFKGFSKISKTLDPKDLVNILDSYFATFDEITGRHYIEKIKTIGDAYMCAGGLPLSNKSNPIDAVLAGLEIQNYLNALNDTKVINNLQVWELRIGVHTGQVVAGVVGKKRFAYDIWGDTVNIASRMEQSGHVGMVNISGITYDYIKDFFDCDYRGKIETKNLGKIDMYFVNRIKPEFSQDHLGILPNDVMMNLVNKL